jgi:hypothetical protein
MGSTAIWTPEKHLNSKGYGKPELKKYIGIAYRYKKARPENWTGVDSFRQAD